MKKSNETSLQVKSSDGLFKKIMKFINRLFNKGDTTSVSSKKVNDNSNIENPFMQSIKFEKDPEKEMLLKIQDDLEKMGINEENAYELTKNLSDEQKNKLLKLYEEQIETYKTKIENHKNRILEIRKNNN